MPCLKHYIKSLIQLLRQMRFLKPILFFTFLLFQPLLANNDCHPQYCGSNPLPIRFPFSLQGGQQPPHCGHPDFILTCSGQESRGIPVLNMPDVGNFSVREINYLMQEIHLRDLNGCLPSKLISLSRSPSSSPFAAAYEQNFTFLSCPRGATRLATVECLSNSTAAVVATSSEDLARLMSGNCSTMFTVPVPESWSENSNEWLSSGLSGDLKLTWSFPDCRGCESRGGVCGYDRNSSGETQQIVCYFDKGVSRSLETFKIIALSIVVPSIICSICISIFVCIMETRASRIRNVVIAAAPPSQPPAEPPATVGLDEITIESYKKVVLGESKRLPGPNGATCPICLVDYNPKDTLRCIPECQHCFHSDCVDEWLRLNSSCPVCRTSPLHPSATR